MPLLELKKVSKSFRGRQVLDGLSLSVEPGEIALLVGESGSGKSTLLRILAGLEQPDSGSFCPAKAVGMVFQKFHLFSHLTALENLLLPLLRVGKKSREEAGEIAEKLLERYGLKGRGEQRPHQLSGGEQQRLAIARATALKPPLICMDEPTSALDPANTARVAEEIQSLAASGYAVVVATHHLELVKQLKGSIHLLKEGRLVVSPKELDNFLAGVV